MVRFKSSYVFKALIQYDNVSFSKKTGIAAGIIAL